MDWEAEWNKLVNKARVSETQLAGSARSTVRDFCRWWDRYTPSLPLYKQKSVRSLTPQKPVKLDTDHISDSWAHPVRRAPMHAASFDSTSALSHMKLAK